MLLLKPPFHSVPRSLFLSLSPGLVSIYESRHLPAGRHKACWGLWGLQSVKGLFFTQTAGRQTDRRRKHFLCWKSEFHMLILIWAAGDTGVTAAILKVSVSCRVLGGCVFRFRSGRHSPNGNQRRGHPTQRGSLRNSLVLEKCSLKYFNPNGPSFKCWI